MSAPGLPEMTLIQTLLIAALQCIAVTAFVFVLVPLTTFAERKVLGYLQVRLGATRIASGLHGLTGGLNRGMWAMGKVPVLPSLAASRREPAMSTGVFKGKLCSSASGAVPTRPITEDRTVRMGRGPLSISTTSTP